MVKKKKVKKKVVDPWFRERLRKKDGWSFIPLNWKGWVSLIVLLVVNCFAAIYFNINELILDNWLKMGVVFLLSIFVFVEIAKRRTRGLRR
ncbi:hypothetical protein HNV12_00790 [Methanococcoides sp. SA1]|nr:hypothetical protein [Methanococcoides sp. SA1]